MILCDDYMLAFMVTAFLESVGFTSRLDLPRIWIPGYLNT